MIVWDPADPANLKPLSRLLLVDGDGPGPVVVFGSADTLFTSGSEGQLVSWDLTDPTVPREVA